MRRDERDPEVSDDGYLRLWGHRVRVRDVRRASWGLPGGQGPGEGEKAQQGEAAGRLPPAAKGSEPGGAAADAEAEVAAGAGPSGLNEAGRAAAVEEEAPAAAAGPSCSSSAKSRDDEFLFAPHVGSLTPGSPDFDKYLQIFMERWAARQPVLVRGLRSRMQWGPEVMQRATREQGSKRFNIDSTDTHLQVLDCRGFEQTSMTQYAFFQHYMYNSEVDESGRPRMLKVKDWPPDEHFRVRMVRHNQDFLEMLPLTVYTHPHHAPLNLATMIPGWANPTDLGPKTYIASGQVEEHEEERDSVTKLHQDMSDAVNILLHCQHTAGEPKPGPARCGLEAAQRGSGYGGAGAVWDVWRCSDAPALRSYLRAHVDEFVHHGQRLDGDKVGDVVFDHCFMLSSSHLDRMANPAPDAALQQQQQQQQQQQGDVGSCSSGAGANVDGRAGAAATGTAAAQPSGVMPWHFEQYQDEAVFIPAGCPHQVRNLRSCIKVAVDFVSPEALTQTLAQTNLLSACPRNKEAWPSPQESIYQDKLQGRLILMSAAVECYLALHPELEGSVCDRVDAWKRLEDEKLRMGAQSQAANAAASNSAAAAAAAGTAGEGKKRARKASAVLRAQEEDSKGGPAAKKPRKKAVKQNGLGQQGKGRGKEAASALPMVKEEGEGEGADGQAAAAAAGVEGMDGAEAGQKREEGGAPVRKKKGSDAGAAAGKARKKKTAPVSATYYPPRSGEEGADDLMTNGGEGEGEPGLKEHGEVGVKEEGEHEWQRQQQHAAAPVQRPVRARRAPARMLEDADGAPAGPEGGSGAGGGRLARKASAGAGGALGAAAAGEGGEAGAAGAGPGSKASGGAGAGAAPSRKHPRFVPETAVEEDDGPDLPFLVPGGKGKRRQGVRKDSSPDEGADGGGGGGGGGGGATGGLASWLHAVQAVQGDWQEAAPPLPQQLQGGADPVGLGGALFGAALGGLDGLPDLSLLVADVTRAAGQLEQQGQAQGQGGVQPLLPPLPQPRGRKARPPQRSAF